MELILKKKPKNVTIIEGFPGFGLVGTITTEFLINHLDCEEIGQIIVKDSSAVVAIHEESLIKPITLYYNKKYNLIIIHSISPGAKVEWKIAKAIRDVSKATQAKQILSIEGVMSKNPTDNIFYFANKEKMNKTLQASGLLKMKEGIVVGVTAALLTLNHRDFVSLFAETQMDLPDSMAASRIIMALDKYLGLKVDNKPLVKQAELFEAKIKSVMEQGMVATDAQKRKQLNYVG